MEIKTLPGSKTGPAIRRDLNLLFFMKTNRTKEFIKCFSALWCTLINTGIFQDSGKYLSYFFF